MAMSTYLPGFIKFITRNKTSELHAAEFVLSSQNPSFGQTNPRLLSTRGLVIWKHQTSPQSVACTCTGWHGLAALKTFGFGPVSDGLNQIL
jgi:hypothetical protein